MGDAQTLWKACCDVLEGRVSEAVWRSTFQGTRALRDDGDVLVLAVPNAVARDRIGGTYLALVREALHEVSGEPVDIVLEIRPDAAGSTIGPADATPVLNGSGVPDHIEASPPTEPQPPSPSLPAPPQPSKYTFEAFVTGPSNRFAHAAALSVAETPGHSFNPLFIYGDAGLGKTHLLQAIGSYVAENYPHYEVRYVSSETFLNEFVEAIRAGTNDAFRRRYRDVNVLLVDDIQFVEKWKETQEEFFHTFNALHEANRQIVLSSDRPPDAISTLEARLRSRFMMGLITDIQPPDLETRLAILRKKAEQERHPIPDPVLEFIATHITDNIRELQGALTRVAAFASLTGEPVTVELAERVLADILGSRQPRPITPSLILETTASMFGFSVAEIQGTSRRRPLVIARQVAMYVMRELTDLSYPLIAREFGGRDHTTAIHSVEKVKALMSERRAVYDQVTELIQVIKKGG